MYKLISHYLGFSKSALEYSYEYLVTYELTKLKLKITTPHTTLHASHQPTTTTTKNKKAPSQPTPE